MCPMPNPERGESTQSRYRSLPEASSQRVILNFSLPPFIDREQIGVNTQAIEYLCQLAGIRRLIITSSTNGETTQSVPVILGSRRDGTAVAGHAITKVKADIATADQTQVTNSNNPLFTSKAKDWIDLRIELNMNEIQRKIEQGKWKRGVADTSAWTHYINKAISTKIANRGLKHLIVDGHPLNYVALTMTAGLSILIGLPKTLLEAAIWYLYCYPGTDYFTDLLWGANQPTRLSILGPYAPALDRAGLLELLSFGRKHSRKFPLVKALSK